MQQNSSYRLPSNFDTTTGRAFLFNVLENGPTAITLVDRGGHFVYVNRRFTELTGYSGGEVLGRHTRVLKSGNQTPDAYRQMWDWVLSGRDWVGEFQNRKKNGDLYWERATILPIVEETGEVEYFIKLSVDITERKRIQEELVRSHGELIRRESMLVESLDTMRRVTGELQEARERYERLVQATNGFVYSVALDDGKVVASENYPGCEHVTGYTAEAYAQDPDLWHRMIYPDDVGLVLQQVSDLTGGKPVVVVEHRILHRDGRLRWLRNTAVARRDGGGAVHGYEGLVTDITAFKQAEEDREALTGQLREMALRDTLTGLMNRRGFEDELNRLWSLALRHPFPIGMLVIDIDRFKTLNDSYGHVVGDEVLAECARLVLDNVRTSDVVCRFGGDEMTVILPWSERSDTHLVARRILLAFQNHLFSKGKHEFQVTASIGTATLTPGPELTSSGFLACADKALYRAKQSGRNRVCEWENLVEVVKERESVSPDVPLSPDAPPSGRVLVVDDDESTRKVLQRMLEYKGFEAQGVETAAGALERIDQQRGMVDVALVDLNLGMDSGLDLIQRMQERDDTLICIVITGQANLESVVASMRSGAYDFLPKPFTSAQLMVALHRAVKYRRLLLENRRYQFHLENMVREKSAAHTRALERLSASFQFTLETMAGMLDARELNTGEHSKRVARLCSVLARHMGLPPETIDTLETGALLHDIGKIAIPDAILMKPGPLTHEEQVMMRKHPQIGYDMIQGNPDLKDASEIVLSHHEHYDGNGYPRGLKGEDICFGARIFSVVDAYDAMRAERPYSGSLDAESTLAEILRQKGTQFDPEVVNALLACHEEIEREGDWDADSPRPGA